MQLRPAGGDAWYLVGVKAGLAPFPPGTVKVMANPAHLKVLPTPEFKHLER
jgi:hypothetical protein